MFSHKVPDSYEIMHEQYLCFSEYTKCHNKPMSYEHIKQTIQTLQILSKSDDLQEYKIQDNFDQMANEFNQRIMQKIRNIDEKRIQILLSNQKYLAQNNIKMEDLKHNFKNYSILMSNYRGSFQSFFDSEDKNLQKDNIKILEELKQSFQLELKKLQKMYPGQALFILEQLRPKIIGGNKNVEKQSKDEQSEPHPLQNKGSLQISQQHQI